MSSQPQTNLSNLISDPQEAPIVIPVIEEHVEIRKEPHATGVIQIRKVVHQQEAEISESLLASKVEVERVPKNIFVDSPPPVRTEGDVTIIPVVEEILVVTKQLRLVEEVRIVRKQSSTVHQEKVALRLEEVVVERVAASDSNS